MAYTRVTNDYLSETVVQNLLTNRTKLVDLQTQISSGKRISKPSDDVIASISVVSTNNSLGKIGNYLKNIDNAQSELDYADKALTTVVDSVQSARELIVQVLNSSSGPSEIQSINDQIKQLIDQIKDAANTKFENKYIFGGRETDSPPFAVPVTGEVKYVGSADGSGDRNVEISDGVTVPINITGDRIFGEYYTGDHDNDILTPDTLDGQGLFKTLIGLSNELDLASPDMNAVRQGLDSLDANLQTVINVQTQLGSVSNRMEMTKTNLQDSQVNLTKLKSGAEDIDLAKAISDLQFQQTALQASLQISAKVIQPSLLNYI